MAAVERLPILYHSADYISFPLGSLGPLWYIWKWSSAHVYARGRKQCCKLHYCLWKVSIKPRLSFSYLWCVLCFQRQSLWRLFWYDSVEDKTHHFPVAKRAQCYWATWLDERQNVFCGILSWSMIAPSEGGRLIWIVCAKSTSRDL